eukprot:9381855-Lingulodinium_polyedra.AAC.1
MQQGKELRGPALRKPGQVPKLGQRDLPCRQAGQLLSDGHVRHAELVGLARVAPAASQPPRLRARR